MDSALLWLWRRMAATAPIRPLAWEPPYATGVAPEKAKRQKKKKIYIYIYIYILFIGISKSPFRDYLLQFVLYTRMVSLELMRIIRKCFMGRSRGGAVVNKSD